MKVFFIGDRKSEDSKKQHGLIIKALERHGLTVDKSHYHSTALEDEKNIKESYDKYMKCIKNNEVIVAEVSHLSSGLGFFISAALSNNQPVLALFNINSNEKPSKTLKGSTDKLMSFVEYDSKNLDKIIRSYFTKIKSKLDSKFILIISAEIDRYLQWSSHEYRMHKAQIVREAIEKVMRKDREYKKYLEKA